MQSIVLIMTSSVVPVVLVHSSENHLEESGRPITPVGEQSQIGERFLRRSALALDFGEFVGEFYEQTTVTLALIRWKYENAGHVVVLGRFFLLGEVADNMKSAIIALTHYVEEERIRVVVQRLVVEEQFGEKTQILSVLFVLPSVDLKEANLPSSINLVARRMFEETLGEMSF